MLSRSVRGISHMVESCWRVFVREFRLDPSWGDGQEGSDGQRAQRSAFNVTFHPYNNFVVSRERLQHHPLTSYLNALTRLVTFGACLYPPTATGSRAEDGPSYGKLHASAFEVLQDAIFGLQPVESAPYAFPASKFDCAPSSAPMRQHRHDQKISVMSGGVVAQ